jgi:hypothetical protein
MNNGIKVDGEQSRRKQLDRNGSKPAARGA